MENQKPNFVFFVPDEMRGDLVGSPHIQLPHLDALREDGVTFEQSYVVNPVCGPSRCCIFTGQYPHDGGHRSLYQVLLPHEQNLFRLLKEDGYHVHYIGRNDLLYPETEALSVTERKGSFVDMMAAEIRHILATKDIPELTPEKRASLEETLGVGQFGMQIFTEYPEIAAHLKFARGAGWPEGHRHERSFYHGEIPPEDLATEHDHLMIQMALDFLANPPEEPFVLYVGLMFPHPPYKVEEPYFSMYDRDRVPFPVMCDYDDKPSFMAEIHKRYGLDRMTEADWREIVATYYGMTNRVDDQLGQVVAALKEKDLYDNTAIFFFSDHGDYAGDYALTEKWPTGFQDNLMRVPFVVKMPKQEHAGQTSAALVEMIDMLPTVLELAEIETSYTHFGRSLMPVITGETDEHRDAVFGAGGYDPREPQCFESGVAGIYEQKILIQADLPGTASRSAMIRTRTHKLIIRTHEKDELYDLQADPNETRNLIDNPDYAGIENELRLRMLQWYLETSDNPYHEKKRVM